MVGLCDATRVDADAGAKDRTVGGPLAEARRSASLWSLENADESRLDAFDDGSCVLWSDGVGMLSCIVRLGISACDNRDECLC